MIQYIIFEQFYKNFMNSAYHIDAITHTSCLKSLTSQYYISTKELAYYIKSSDQTNLSTKVIILRNVTSCYAKAKPCIMLEGSNLYYIRRHYLILYWKVTSYFADSWCSYKNTDKYWPCKDIGRCQLCKKYW